MALKLYLIVASYLTISMFFFFFFLMYQMNGADLTIMLLCLKI